MDEKITIDFRPFSIFKEVFGITKQSIELPVGATVSDLLDTLSISFPELEKHLSTTIIAVNRSYARKDLELHEGDEVAIFPPVSGGCDCKDRSANSHLEHVAVTMTPIDPAEILDLVAEPGAGAVVSFTGIVRDQNLGRSVDYLEYDAYIEMASEKLRQVISQAREKWPKIRRFAVVHRIGHLDLGETAVMVAVGAPHRDDGAFEAARFAIDRIKEIVPIWKKEGWSDGAEWLNGDYLPKPGE